MEQVLKKYKAQLKQLKSRLKSYLTVNVKRLENKMKVNEEESHIKRRSPRLSKLKERILQLSRNKKSLEDENIFEPRPNTRSQKSSNKGTAASGSRAANQNKFTESRATKRNLRGQVLESASAKKKRRHS